jgi:hypothetical protein
VGTAKIGIPEISAIAVSTIKLNAHIRMLLPPLIPCLAAIVFIATCQQSFQLLLIRHHLYPP